MVDQTRREQQEQGPQGESPLAAFFRAMMQMFSGFGLNNDDAPQTDNRSQAIMRLQQDLAEQGLYPSTGPYAQDGVAGDVTRHALRLRDEPGYAERYMREALKDQDLSTNDVMKIQASLNKLGYDVGDVNGRLNNDTRDDIAKFLKEHPDVQREVPTQAAEAVAPKSGLGRIVESVTEGFKSTRDHVFAPESTPGSARSLLAIIGQHESGQNYNAVYGHTRGNGVDFTNMTVNEVLQWQRQYVREGSPSSAVGRYQIIRGTLEGLKDEMGLSGNERFDASLQDRMATRLLERRGLSDYREGRISETQFMDRVAREWASMPTHTGRGHYDGDGLNAVGARTTPVLAAIRDIRAAPEPAAVQTAEAHPAAHRAPVQTAHNDVDFGRSVVTTVKEGMEGAANRLGLNSAFQTASSLWDKASDALGLGNDAPATQMAQAHRRSGASLG